MAVTSELHAHRSPHGIPDGIAGWGGFLPNIMIWLAGFPPTSNPLIDGEHMAFAFDPVADVPPGRELLGSRPLVAKAHAANPALTACPMQRWNC